MHPLVESFQDYRAQMNARILGRNNKVINRLFNLDTHAYSEGHLSVKTKEFIGLAASLVLRCDDCVKYHLQRCYELNATTEEVFEVFGLACLIGGTIVIPHLRRAVEFWDALHQGRSEHREAPQTT
ncbi:MAG: carboxymuconolactone decarboxylase family protein [Chitinophagales bacterium]|nr:carboxymuconolactone decarboxylase family protein [Chitinophagales bacterium]MDW8427225.1 carboxymuconolactone decarboxylase family protein [Chitinophagales bacterium]